MADGRGLLCIAQPRLGEVTETFIAAHVGGLPGPVLTLHGEPFPIWDGKGTPLASPLRGLTRRLLSRAIGVAPERLDRGVVVVLGTAARDRILARSFERRGVRAVLAEYGPTGVALAAACRAAGVPLVVHFHGYDAAMTAVIEEHGDSYRDLFEVAARVVAVSSQMQGRLIALGCPPQKIALIPYGVEVDPSGPSADPRRSPPILLAVGRFVDKKAPHLTLLAFSRIVGSHPGARLEMVGDGPLRESCIAVAAALGLEECTRFPGTLSTAEVAARMAEVRGFVQHSVRPSSGDMEGTPVAVLEAMAAGLPVVSTRHGGIVDAVVEDVTGWLVDEGDVSGMAAAMARLIHDPERAAELGRAGWQRALEHYRREDRLRQLGDLLRSVVGAT